MSLKPRLSKHSLVVSAQGTNATTPGDEGLLGIGPYAPDFPVLSAPDQNLAVTGP